MPPRGGGFTDELEVDGELIFQKKDDTKQKIVSTLPITSWHVSCRSDPITGKNMIGMVVYAKNNMQDFRTNGIHVKSGYIILKEYDNIKHINTQRGTAHSKLFKWFFDEEFTSTYNCSGFAIKNENRKYLLKFNSGTFQDNGYHKEIDGKRYMLKLESWWVKEAVKMWKSSNGRCQNLNIAAHQVKVKRGTPIMVDKNMNQDDVGTYDMTQSWCIIL
eukprot:402757_1